MALLRIDPVSLSLKRVEPVLLFVVPFSRQQQWRKRPGGSRKIAQRLILTPVALDLTVEAARLKLVVMQRVSKSATLCQPLLLRN